MERILFMINSYDSYGDVVDKGIFLSYGNISVNIGNDLKAIDSIIENLQSIKDEILYFINEYPQIITQ